MKMFNIPNLFTASNMLCGIFAIILAFAGRIDIAPYFIFLAAVLDFFDGFLARLLKQQGELGKQLDSLADMISFGLAPGIMILVILVGQTTMIDPESLFWHGEYVTSTTHVEMVSGDSFFSLEMLTASLHSWMNSFFEWKNMNWLPFVALIIPFFSMFIRSPLISPPHELRSTGE